MHSAAEVAIVGRNPDAAAVERTALHALTEGSWSFSGLKAWAKTNGRVGNGLDGNPFTCTSGSHGQLHAGCQGCQHTNIGLLIHHTSELCATLAHQELNSSRDQSWSAASHACKVWHGTNQNGRAVAH
jgi:hypothetical protein